MRSPIRRQPPTTPELKMVVAGIEEGAVERKRKQAADALATPKNDSGAVLAPARKERRPRQDNENDGGGSSSGGDGEEEDGEGEPGANNGESPTKRRKTNFSAQGYPQRLEEAIQACMNAVKQAEQRLGEPVKADASGTAPIYYRWSSLARAKYIEPAWQFLSNMSPFPVTIGGIVYPTLEHYYHVMKFVHARSLPIKFESVEQMKSNPVVAKLLSMPDPEKVKQLMGKKGSMGKKLPFNWVAWSKAIPEIMMEAKLLKARQYPGIRRLLLESGNRTIAERKLSHRKKTPPEPSEIRGMLVFYKGQWYGDNASGKMWMRVRKQLQQEEYERAQIEARARHRGKLVLVESDEEEEEREKPKKNENDEEEVVAVVEELIEEETDGGASGDDEEEEDGEDRRTERGKRSFIISHVKDEHVTIAHNPEEGDWIVQREREREREERKRPTLSACPRKSESEGALAVGAKRQRSPPVLAATKPHEERQRRNEVTSAQTTYVPAEVFREHVKALETELKATIVEEEAIVVEEEVVEEEVIEEVIEEVDFFDMSDSESDDSDSADDSDSDVSEDAYSEDDGY